MRHNSPAIAPAGACGCQQRFRPTDRMIGEQEAHEIELLAEFGPLIGPLARAARYAADSLVRYGCYCGPGKVCNRVFDNIDLCCKAHDDAYTRARVNVPGGTDMWTPAGLLRTRTADRTLVRCALRTTRDGRRYSDRADAYRRGITQIFSTRASVADRLAAFPDCIRTNSKVPVWNLSGLVSGCW